MSREKIDGEFSFMYALDGHLIAFLIEILKRQKIGISKFSARHKSEILWLIYNLIMTKWLFRVFSV